MPTAASGLSASDPAVRLALAFVQCTPAVVLSCFGKTHKILQLRWTQYTKKIWDCQDIFKCLFIGKNITERKAAVYGQITTIQIIDTKSLETDYPRDFPLDFRREKEAAFLSQAP